MNYDNTALILIGFQNDYFAENGILHAAIEEPSQIKVVLENTLTLIKALEKTPTLMISTPIMFTPTYEELDDPVGILKMIKEVGAFNSEKPGSQTIPELSELGGRITEVAGRRGLNAFTKTDLNKILESRQIKYVIIAGILTSVCVDSTGRAAHDLGYHVSIIKDCTTGRTTIEQDFFCENVFPLYASTISYQEFLEDINSGL